MSYRPQVSFKAAMVYFRSKPYTCTEPKLIILVSSVGSIVQRNTTIATCASDQRFRRVYLRIQDEVEFATILWSPGVPRAVHHPMEVTVSFFGQ